MMREKLPSPALIICLLALAIGCDEPKPVSTTEVSFGSTSGVGISRSYDTEEVEESHGPSVEDADVSYDNPNTGTHSDYTLEVERDSEGNLDRINFPNGGYKDVGGDTVDNGDGTETYTDSHGVDYTVTKPEED